MKQNTGKHRGPNYVSMDANSMIGLNSEGYIPRSEGETATFKL